MANVSTAAGRLMSKLAIVLVLAGLVMFGRDLGSGAGWTYTEGRIERIYEVCFVRACPTCQRQRMSCNSDAVTVAAPADVQRNSYAEIHYVASNGRNIVVRPSLKRSELAYAREGNPVPLRYRPNQPTTYQLVAAIPLGLLLLVAGGALLTLRLAMWAMRTFGGSGRRPMPQATGRGGTILDRLGEALGQTATGQRHRTAASGPAAGPASPWGRSPSPWSEQAPAPSNDWADGKRKAPPAPASPPRSQRSRPPRERKTGPAYRPEVKTTVLEKHVPRVAIPTRRHRTGRARGLFG
jgi:hypothetical protein